MLTFVVQEKKGSFTSNVLEKLKKIGCSVRIVEEGKAGKDEIALLFYDEEFTRQWWGNFPGRHVRTSPFRMLDAEAIPGWALPFSPRILIVREHPDDKFEIGLRKSLENVVTMYKEGLLPVKKV